MPRASVEDVARQFAARTHPLYGSVLPKLLGVWSAQYSLDDLARLIRQVRAADARLCVEYGKNYPHCADNMVEVASYIRAQNRGSRKPRNKK